MSGPLNEEYCLRWDDFESKMSQSFRSLRDDKDFFDVTLCCDSGQVEAHKVIISASSSFFRRVLKKNPHQHPLLFLRGVEYKELMAVLDFMYQGQVNVALKDLDSFLALAEDLGVKGITMYTKDEIKSKTGMISNINIAKVSSLVNGICALIKTPIKKENPIAEEQEIPLEHDSKSRSPAKQVTENDEADGGKNQPPGESESIVGHPVSPVPAHKNTSKGKSIDHQVLGTSTNSTLTEASERPKRRFTLRRTVNQLKHNNSTANQLHLNKSTINVTIHDQLGANKSTHNKSEENQFSPIKESEKHFYCDYCEYVGKKKRWNLTRHVKKHHPNEYSESARSSSN